MTGLDGGQHALARNACNTYALTVLERHAVQPSMEEVLERVSERSGGRVSLQDAVDAVHTERDDRP